MKFNPFLAMQLIRACKILCSLFFEVLNKYVQLNKYKNWIENKKGYKEILKRVSWLNKEKQEIANHKRGIQFNKIKYYVLYFARFASQYNSNEMRKTKISSLIFIK